MDKVTIASAAGKIILFGEHAVVYGRPALAAPLSELRARVRVESRGRGGIVVHARDLKTSFELAAAPATHPLAAIACATLAELRAPAALGLELWIESDLPPASHLGSSAAVSTAIVRALAAHLEHPLPPEKVSALVFETEKLYHGTPSGIDNTVIALEQVIRFTSARGAEPIHIARAFTLALANTGVPSPTKIAVGDVRRAWARAPARYEQIFDDIAVVVAAAQDALARGENVRLGELMQRNQELLRQLDVSSPEIENLLRAATAAGAAGGKLSGGGRGGNIIVSLEPERAAEIQRALLTAGATSVLVTAVNSNW